MKKCQRCGKKKSLDAFYRQAKAPDGLQYRCKDCVRIVLREHREANRDLYRQRKKVRYHKLREEALAILGGCCAHCGNDDIRVLEFDHVNGGGNQERYAQMRERFCLDIINGLRDDVQPLCANCHRIKTYHS